MNVCKINVNLCKGCGICVKFCPKHVLEISDELNPSGFHPAHPAKPELCTACAICAEMCPETAIEIYRRKKSRAS